jgi:hypothetical protein
MKISWLAGRNWQERQKRNLRFLEGRFTLHGERSGMNAWIPRIHHAFVVNRKLRKMITGSKEMKGDCEGSPERCSTLA